MAALTVTANIAQCAALVSTAKIEIGYNGEAVAQGTMDVRELAPALLALGDLLQQANRVLNEDSGQLATHVKSDFRTGSFEVNLELVQKAADALSSLFKKAQHFNAAQIAAFVGVASGAGVSLIKFLKWLGKRKIKLATVIENGNMKIETDGEYDSIEVSQEVIRLARSERVRFHLSAVLRPLKSIGFDLFYAKAKGQQIECVKKEEIEIFEAPQLVEQELIDEHRRAAVKLIEISFEEGLKWKLSDGENRFNVTVLDKEFQKQIDGGKTFSKDDILVVELRTRQVAVGDRIRTENELVKVLNHIPAGKQSELGLQLPQRQPPTESNS